MGSRHSATAGMAVATSEADLEPLLRPMAQQTAEFQPQLQQAQENLEVALKEACAMDVKKANTGELIHIDELLAIAGDSAKQVISVRRRMRRDAGAKGSATKGATAKTPASKGRASKATAPAVDTEWVDRAPKTRVLEDARRVRWTIFAVRPSKTTSDRANLPTPFQTGWLSFDSGSETRRLSPIPDGWHLLSDDELRALCERAEVAAPRRTSKEIKPR